MKVLDNITAAKKTLLAASIAMISGSAVFASDPVIDDAATGLLSCPKGVIKYIGELSGNTLSLKETCVTLKRIEFKTQREVILWPYSDQFHSIIGSFIHSGRQLSAINLAPLFPRDDVTVLNLYAFRQTDFCMFGLLPVGQEESEDEMMAKILAFPGIINKGRLRRINQIRLRSMGCPTMPSSELPLHDMTIQTLSSLGMRSSYIQDVTFGYDAFVSYGAIDSVFDQLRLSAAEFYQLMCLTGCVRDPQELFESNHAYLGHFVMKNNDWANGELGIRYLRRVADSDDLIPTHLPTRSHLKRVLDAYSALTRDWQDYVCTMMENPRDRLAVTEVLLALSDQPEALRTVEMLVKMRLTWGIHLFGTHRLEAVPNLVAMSHGNTGKILELIRQFIPGFVERDYYFIAEAKNRLLKLNKPSNIYGEKQHNNLGTHYGVFDRRLVFDGFCRSLSKFSQGEQLLRLQKLLQVLKLEHFREYVNHNPDFNMYIGYSPQLTRAMRFIHDLTPDETCNSFPQIAERVRNKYPQFNPLMETAENEFEEALGSSKSKNQSE